MMKYIWTALRDESIRVGIADDGSTVIHISPVPTLEDLESLYDYIDAAAITSLCADLTVWSQEELDQLFDHEEWDDDGL